MGPDVQPMCHAKLEHSISLCHAKWDFIFYQWVNSISPCHAKWDPMFSDSGKLNKPMSCLL